MSTKVPVLVRHYVQTNVLNTVTVMKSNLSWVNLNCHTMFWDTAVLNSALRWTVSIFHHILHDKVISTYNFCFVQPRWWLGCVRCDCFINICYAHLLCTFEHKNVKFVHYKYCKFWTKTCAFYKQTIRGTQQNAAGKPAMDKHIHTYLFHATSCVAISVPYVTVSGA